MHVFNDLLHVAKGFLTTILLFLLVQNCFVNPNHSHGPHWKLPICLQISPNVTSFAKLSYALQTRELSGLRTCVSIC